MSSTSARTACVPLNVPLIEIQEALAELEAIDLPAQAGRRLMALAKELGNHFSAVRVGGAGLETEDDPAKRLRWLDLMQGAVDGRIRTLDQMHPLMPGPAGGMVRLKPPRRTRPVDYVVPPALPSAIKSAPRPSKIAS